MSSQLCKYCLSILTTNNTACHPHHSASGELLASAAAGCPLCTILCDCLRNISWPQGTSFETSSAKFHFKIKNDHLGELTVPTIFLGVEIVGREERGKRPNFWIAVMIVPANDVSPAIPSGTLDRNTGSEETWKVATHWLEACINTHRNCCPPGQPKLLPTRLLDVGSQESPTLRLHLTDGSPLNTPYVTLSHCWGSIPIERLVKSKLDSMLNEIPIVSLPQTFRDAISITRRLGARYLWIDSLCIIQDSEEDWVRESAMMGSVYQNGICNIAATAASNGTVGCFFERDPLLAQPCRVTIERDLRKFKLKKGTYDLVPRKLWETGLSEAPLLRRAWVVQERVLTQRMLHFGKNQLFWECNELDACEMYPTGVPSALAQSTIKGFVTGGQEVSFKTMNFKNLDPSSVRSEVQVLKSPLTYSFIAPLPSGPQVDPYYVWNKIVTTYTRCGITKDTDKLVAISAIAKRIKSMANDEYLAGVWKRHLPYHLMWHTDQHAPDRRRPKEYVAPSWSWASMVAPIEPYVYLRPDNPPMIQILSAIITPKTPDVMGQVNSGFLKLRGRVRRLHVENPKDDDGTPYMSQIVQFDETQTKDEWEVWFLPVISLGPWIAYEALGLLLEETGEKDKFRRVGRFRASGDLATKYFRLPIYPSTLEDKQRTASSSSSGAHDEDIVNGSRFDGNSGLGTVNKRRWFGMKKKTGSKNGWKEQVITII